MTLFYDEFLEYTKVKSIENEKCQKCKIYEFCEGKGCFANSLSEHGDIHKPKNSICWFSRLTYNLIENNSEWLEKNYK